MITTGRPLEDSMELVVADELTAMVVGVVVVTLGGCPRNFDVAEEMALLEPKVVITGAVVLCDMMQARTVAATRTRIITG